MENREFFRRTWCWYKIITLLEESSLQLIALDLAGFGTKHTGYFSCGGAIAPYALEHFPKKVSKVVFVSATMVSSGQSPFDVFSEQLGLPQVFLNESQFLLYGNGKEKPATGLQFGKGHGNVLYFNQNSRKVHANAILLLMFSLRVMYSGT